MTFLAIAAALSLMVLALVVGFLAVMFILDGLGGRVTDDGDVIRGLFFLAVAIAAAAEALNLFGV